MKINVHVTLRRLIAVKTSNFSCVCDILYWSHGVQPRCEKEPKKLLGDIVVKRQNIQFFAFPKIFRWNTANGNQLRISWRTKRSILQLIVNEGVIEANQYPCTPCRWWYYRRTWFFVFLFLAIFSFRILMKKDCFKVLGHQKKANFAPIALKKAPIKCAWCWCRSNLTIRSKSFCGFFVFANDFSAKNFRKPKILDIVICNLLLEIVKNLNAPSNALWDIMLQVKKPRGHVTNSH